MQHSEPASAKADGMVGNWSPARAQLRLTGRRHGTPITGPKTIRSASLARTNCSAQPATKSQPGLPGPDAEARGQRAGDERRP